MSTKNEMKTKLGSDEYQKRVGLRIQKYRQEKGITQEELAAQLFISRSQIARYESGSCAVPIYCLYCIAEYLGVGLECFLKDKCNSTDSPDDPLTAKCIERVRNASVKWKTTILLLLNQE